MNYSKTKTVGPYTYHHEIQRVKYGLYPAIFGILAALIPYPITRVLAYILVPIGLFKIFYHGSTLISIKLNGSHRLIYQLVLSIITPISLSMFFFVKAPPKSFDAAIMQNVSPWILLPLAIIYGLGIFAGEQANKSHPYRIFVLGSIILFLSLLLGFYEINLGDGDWQYDDFEMPIGYKQKYFAQYLTYVLTYYVGAFLKLRKRSALSP